MTSSFWRPLVRTRGALRYPSYSGGWQLGDLDLSEHLDRYRDHEIVVIIASMGVAG